MPRILPLINEADCCHQQYHPLHVFYESVSYFSRLKQIQHMRVKLLALIDAPAQVNILDYACNVGDSVQSLVQQFELGSKIMGVDDSAFISQAIASNRHPACQFSKMPLDHLSFDADQFDYIYAERIFHVTHDAERVLKSFASILKAKGALLILEPDFSGWQCDGLPEAYQAIIRDFLMARCATPDFINHLHTALASAGFSVRESLTEGLVLSTFEPFNQYYALSSILSLGGVDSPECDEALLSLREKMAAGQATIRFPMVYMCADLS